MLFFKRTCASISLLDDSGAYAMMASIAVDYVGGGPTGDWQTGIWVAMLGQDDYRRIVMLGTKKWGKKKRKKKEKKRKGKREKAKKWKFNNTTIVHASA